jgi:hypothetical protein
MNSILFLLFSLVIIKTRTGFGFDPRTDNTKYSNRKYNLIVSGSIVVILGAFYELKTNVFSPKSSLIAFIIIALIIATSLFIFNYKRDIDEAAIDFHKTISKFKKGDHKT